MRLYTWHCTARCRVTCRYCSIGFQPIWRQFHIAVWCLRTDILSWFQRCPYSRGATSSDTFRIRTILDFQQLSVWWSRQTFTRYAYLYFHPVPYLLNLITRHKRPVMRRIYVCFVAIQELSLIWDMKKTKGDVIVMHSLGSNLLSPSSLPIQQ